MDKTVNALLHGTLDALILKTLSGAPRHGYAIARWIEEATGDALQIEDGSLYPSLYRMEQKEWIEAEWGQSELGRRVKLYRITPAGRERLAHETRAVGHVHEGRVEHPAAGLAIDRTEHTGPGRWLAFRSVRGCGSRASPRRWTASSPFTSRCVLASM